MDLKISIGDLDSYRGFIDESRVHLYSIDQKALGMEDTADGEAVNALLRATHGIKGIALPLSLTDIHRLTHRLETVFDAIRQAKLKVDSELVKAALGNLEHLMTMIRNLEHGLSGKTWNPDGFYSVSIAEVDYLVDYEALGRLLSNSEAPNTTSLSGETGTADPESEPAEESLITPEMRLSFVKESEELLETTEQIFLRLEDAPADSEAIAQAFRNIHSFKGNCGFFGFGDLEQMSHRLETVLDGVRLSGEALSLPLLETTLHCLDVLQHAIVRLEADGIADVPDLARWLGRLDTLAEKRGPATVLSMPLGEILIQENQVSPENVDYALDLQKRPLGQILIEEGLATSAAVAHALDVQANSSRQNRSSGTARSGSRTSGAPAAVKETNRDIRVELGKLDILMDLVGELVISTGMVFNHPIIKGSNAPDLEKISHQLRGVVAELQDVALGVRMVPIEGTFRKMTRLVHDLSCKVGKKVRLDFLGESTEVDKTVVDLIADPLVHMIRNSVDHGLEDAAERAAAGKEPMGVVSLEAGQEGGEIIIHVRDDGRGMNRDRILRKAIERGLVEGDGNDLSDSEVFQFIFKPGFSTAEAVTSTSGRGVGMDVVKSNIDKLGGRISITSRQGKGASIQLRIPLTLSIIDGMMVQVGESLFMLPLTAVRESISPRPQDIFTLMDGEEMLKLRGKTLPIIRLADIYRISGTKTRTGEGLLIHVESRDANFCLAVDNLLGQRQVVVKALPGFMSSVPGTNSCSILDSGEIALILDVSGLSGLSQRSVKENRRDWSELEPKGAEK